MSNSRHGYQRGPEQYVSSTQIGSATITGAALDMTGLSQASLECTVSDGTGTAALTIYAETTNDLSGTPDWHRLQSVAWSSGTGTLSDATWSKATGGAAIKFALNVQDVNAKAIRFVFVMADGGATDLLTVDVTRRA